MKKYNLNISGYVDNAASKFSMKRLVIYTAISSILTILLFINFLQENYEGKALLFTGVALILILGYTILNIKALIKKIQGSKK